MGLLSNFRHKFHNAFFTQLMYGTVASLAIFLTSWDHLDRMRDRLQGKLHQNETDAFDFIVVGAGTAGSVVANRLSQYYSVLLLEYGGEPNPFQAVPGLSLFMPNHQEVDWMHRSVPQKRAFGNSVKREASLSQGKGLGGSGNLNFLNYLRGSPNDYEHWKNVTGDASWGYEAMQKYFKMVEDYSKDSEGSVKINIPDYVGLSAEFIIAGHQLGYKHVDLNDQFVEGFDVNYSPIFNGIRQAPYQSYIKTARARKTLTIRKFSHVTRLLFRDNSTSSRHHCIGVEYERHGQRYVAKAAKEVILSAGALSTPQLLLLSGVGPKEHLQDIGIPVRLNLPVGRNLQDHVSTLIGPFFINDHRSLLIGKEIDTNSFLDWGLHGKGPLTSSFFQASALLLSSFAKNRAEDHNWPDLHLQLSSLGVHKTYAQDLAHAYNLQEPLLTQYYNHAVGKHSFSIAVTNGRPVARGEVLLSGRNPNDKLMIDPRYLEDKHGVDFKILLDGVKIALKLAENSTTFQKLGARLTEKKLPGCEHQDGRSNAYWECYIRQFSLSMHSYCGTASMGKASSKYSVVDPELKVLGAKGLRVIDASVMPSIVVGSPQGAILALAEKGADLILKYWRDFEVPAKKYEDADSSQNSTAESLDSFVGFRHQGKISNKTSSHRGGGGSGNMRKSSKPKTSSKITGGSPHPHRIVVTTSSITSTTSASAPVTTPKSTGEFEQFAESRFSQNLSQIMEYLRNSKAINEAIDDDTYNHLVQNFGERIVELMKKNKTEIFFLPVTSSTTTSSPLVSASVNKSGSSGKNPFSSKFSTQKSNKLLSLSTTIKPKITVGPPKKAPSISSHGVPTSSFAFSSGGKPIVGGGATKFSPLISANSSVNSTKKIIPLGPKKISTTALPSVAQSGPTAIDTLFRGDVDSKQSKVEETTTVKEDMAETTTETWEDVEEDEDENEETTTAKPLNPVSQQPIKKLLELILNPDLSVNKTKEIDHSTYTTLTSSASLVSTATTAGQSKPLPTSTSSNARQLIEYRTEEVRPFPNFPPYKIVSVPGQEFIPTGRLVVPQSLHDHHHHNHIPHHSSILPSHSTSSSSLLLPHGIASLTPPPPPQPHEPLITPSFSHSSPSILTSSNLPTIIDDSLPIQTAKTVLYYTQVFPRDPNEVIPGGIPNGNGGRVVSSSSALHTQHQHREDSQNLVQFFSN